MINAKQLQTINRLLDQRYEAQETLTRLNDVTPNPSNTITLNNYGAQSLSTVTIKDHVIFESVVKTAIAEVEAKLVHIGLLLTSEGYADETDNSTNARSEGKATV